LPDTLFTIITVVRNAESLIIETLNSILSQTYRNFELIIVDGCSSDSTLAKVNDTLITATVRTKILSETDDGIYDAMNKGVRSASSLYTIFINAGDTLNSSDTLLKVCGIINLNQFHEVLYGDSFVSYGNFKVFLRAGKINELVHGMQFSHQATFVATYLLKKYPFDLNFMISSDFDFLLRLYKHKYRFLALQMPVATTLYGGISDSKRISTYSEYLKIVNKDGFRLVSSFLIVLNICFLILKKPIKLFISTINLRSIKNYFS